MRRLVAIILVSVLLPASNAPAKYLMRDLENVPVARLQENLRRQAEENPGKLQPVYALARVHSMAYAQKADSLPAYRKDGSPYFGVGIDSFLPPTRTERSTDPKVRASAREHLSSAIHWYREAIKINEGHAPSLLGLAWCLEQSGEKEEALERYRSAYKAAWETERDAERLSDVCMTCEAANYLLWRLDEEDDEKEIEEILANVRKLKARPRFVTPILVPLASGAPVAELIAPEARVPFDLDGCGERADWGWITAKAAWLVYDDSGRGQIESGLQLLGAVTFWIFWSDGYAALASLDDDGDGELRGAELRGLALWRDANMNGVSEPGEVRTLADWGIEALGCRAEPAADGILISPTGARMLDGSTRPTYDWSPPRHSSSKSVAPAK